MATVLEQRTLAWAEAHVSFISRLVKHGLPVPSPRRCRNGNWIHVHNGKPVMMATFIEGTCTGALTGEELFRLGLILADVHTSGVSCDLRPTNRLTEADLAWLTQTCEDPFARWLLTQYSEIGDVVHDSRAYVPTHGDPFRDNVVVRSDGSLALIDWEDAATDLPEIDLGIAILAHCDKDGIDIARAEFLLSGYRSHAGSRVMSLDGVFRMAAYAGLVLAYRRYRRRLLGVVLPEGHRRLKRMILSLNEH